MLLQYRFWLVTYLLRIISGLNCSKIGILKHKKVLKIGEVSSDTSANPLPHYATFCDTIRTLYSWHDIARKYCNNVLRFGIN
jgi:hypothetical protein